MYSKVSGPHFKTIFTIFENPKLKNELKRFAINNSLKIFIGKPSMPDIIAMTYFLFIVDRNILGINIWNDFLKYNEEAKPIGEYYILVDDREDLNMPKYGKSIQISIDKEDSIAEVMKRCDRIILFSEVQRCLWALDWYLSDKTKIELKNELLSIFKISPVVEVCFYSEIAAEDKQINKDKKLSNYIDTRSDKEIRLYIKEQYRIFGDVQIYYINKMKQLYFSDKDKNVYL